MVQSFASKLQLLEAFLDSLLIFNLQVLLWYQILIFFFNNLPGICFPMGRGVYRVVHIPEDESILLNSREKAPYMISVEVLKAETPR